VLSLAFLETLFVMASSFLAASVTVFHRRASARQNIKRARREVFSLLSACLELGWPRLNRDVTIPLHPPQKAGLGPPNYTRIRGEILVSSPASLASSHHQSLFVNAS